MKNYRDNLIAHHIEANEVVSTYPKLDLALESSYYYYTYLISELRERGEKRFPDDLKEYSADFAEQATEISEKALDATNGMTERVF